MSNTITCPACGHTFSLSDVQKHELEHMRVEMERKIEADMKKRAFAWAQEELKKKDLEAEETRQKMSRDLEEALMKAKRESEELSMKQAIELETLRNRDNESRKKEIEFLREKMLLEQKQKDLELEKDRAILEARKSMEGELLEQFKKQQGVENEKTRLEYEKRMAEMQAKLEMTQRSLEDASRKANQGSMQIQGEVQEEALKSLLSTQFPIDIISDVEKGIKGADLIQEVRNEYGQSVGVIAWESKNTKAWSDGWVEKLKEDRLRVGASVSVIVSVVLPEGVERFGLYRDIWVVEPSFVLPLTILLRSQLVELARVKNSLKGKDEKMEVIYNYLISPEFKAKIENIVEAFSTMKDDLDREKRAMEKMWSAREKQLTRVIDNAARLYGDMQGLFGSRLERVEYLELGSGE